MSLAKVFFILYPLLLLTVPPIEPLHLFRELGSVLLLVLVVRFEQALTALIHTIFRIQ